MGSSASHQKISDESRDECREYIFDMLAQLSALATQIGETAAANNIQNALLLLGKQDQGKISEIVSMRG